MSPDLSDLLIELLSPARRGPEAVDRGWERFLAFMQGRGIEYCNFAVAEVGEDGKSRTALMLSNMAPEWIEEYLDRRLDADDYVVRRAMARGDAHGFDSFAFGGWLVPHLAEHERVSDRVLRGAEDAGMADALAIVGSAPVAPGERAIRHLGFGMGGADGSAMHAEAQRAELVIAAYALINLAQPSIAATLDGYSAGLTPRERDVLAAFARGERRDRVAHRLGIAHQTVDLHSANLRRKLRAQTVAEAVAKAFRYGLL